MMITLVQVCLGKEGILTQYINNLMNAQDGICIDMYGFVEHAVVNSHLKCTLFLIKEQ